MTLLGAHCRPFGCANRLFFYRFRGHGRVHATDPKLRALGLGQNRDYLWKRWTAQDRRGGAARQSRPRPPRSGAVAMAAPPPHPHDGPGPDPNPKVL